MTQELSPNLGKLAAVVSKVSRQRATGQVVCITQKVRLTFHFRDGRLLWITDDRHHRIRRWLRGTKGILAQGLRAQVPRESDGQEVWENRHLSEYLIRGDLKTEQAVTILKRAVTETLFALGDTESLLCRWRRAEDGGDAGGVALSDAAFLQVLHSVYQLQKEWSVLQISRHRAYDGLILNQAQLEKTVSNASAMLNLQKMLEGDRNFWDLLHHFSESPTVAIRLLQHFLQQGMVTFRPLGDRQPNADAAGLSDVGPPATVLCIDDSSQSTAVVQQYLKAQGIDVVICNDPLQAVPLAVKHQPDLILLDLVMPIVNGHEVCAQLRRVKSLEQVPIVMMTGQSGLGNRLRSKLVKASDFIAKPITPQKLQLLVSSHLPGKLPDNKGQPQLPPHLQTTVRPTG